MHLHLNSNAILLNSTSGRFPNGLGNDNGLLGKFVAWHNYRGKGNAQYEGFKDKKTDGRNPSNSLYTEIQKCILNRKWIFSVAMRSVLAEEEEHLSMTDHDR